MGDERTKNKINKQVPPLSFRLLLISFSFSLSLQLHSLIDVILHQHLQKKPHQPLEKEKALIKSHGFLIHTSLSGST